MAGYPWFGVRARDLFIALPGCTLAVGDVETFDSIMHTAMRALKAFMEKGVRSEVIQGIDYPDILSP